MFKIFISILLLNCIYTFSNAQVGDLKKKVDEKALQIESKCIGWRHHLHQNPELSNREFKTAEYVTKHLKSLGLEVKTNVAHTGVVGILRGSKPGPVVALQIGRA